MRTILILSLVTLLTHGAGATADGIDTLLRHAEQYLKRTTAPQNINDIVRTLDSNGQWSDIDYKDQSRSGWGLSAHLERVRSLALAWTLPTSNYFRDRTLKRAIDVSLGHWLKKRYQNPNWWHNAIGVPRLMKDILLLMRHHISESQFAQAMEVLRQHKVEGTGANLVWSADLGLHYGALAGDVEMILMCTNLITKEIRVTTGEGIQPDFSYHQHGPRLQTYHYGSAFLKENIRLAWVVRGTPWEFSAEKINILVDFVLNGWQWMARGIDTVPGTIDRAVSRVNALRAADVRDVLPYLMKLSPERQAPLQALYERQGGSGKPLIGFKHYPRSDFSAYHQDDLSFFLKTTSSRTRLTESINGENLNGALLNAGDAYFIRDGGEYFNLMPTWNWQYLPGITSFQGAVTVPQNFTGGVSSGESGLVSMHYRAEQGGRALSVKKFWAAHRGRVICLLSDLRLKGTDSAYTVLDQSRLRTKVSVAGSIVGTGVHTFRNNVWIHHSGFAYMPLGDDRIELLVQQVTGSWASINQSGSSERLTEEIFMPLLRHNRTSSSSGYVVAPCERAEDAPERLGLATFNVLRNDASCQSIRFDDGMLMAAFHEAGTLHINENTTISVDRPCLLVVSDGEMRVSDPMHTGGPLSIRLGTRSYRIDVPADGTTRRLAHE